MHELQKHEGPGHIDVFDIITFASKLGDTSQ